MDGSAANRGPEENGPDATPAAAGPETFQPDEVDADEGEPDIEPFAGNEQTLRPNPPKDGEHGYGYE